MVKWTGQQIFTIPFLMALKLTKNIIGDPYKRGLSYWRDTGVSDITPHSLAISFRELNLELVLPNPLRNIRKNAGMYASGINPFVISSFMFFRERFLMDYDDKSTVIGKLIWGIDQKGWTHTCWLDCYLYDTSQIKKTMSKFTDEVKSTENEVEVIVRSCDHKIEIGYKIVHALEKLEERSVTLDSFLESLY